MTEYANQRRKSLRIRSQRSLIFIAVINNSVGRKSY